MQFTNCCCLLVHAVVKITWLVNKWIHTDMQIEGKLVVKGCSRSIFSCMIYERQNLHGCLWFCLKRQELNTSLLTFDWVLNKHRLVHVYVTISVFVQFFVWAFEREYFYRWCASKSDGRRGKWLKSMCLVLLKLLLLLHNYFCCLEIYPLKMKVLYFFYDLSLCCIFLSLWMYYLVKGMMLGFCTCLPSALSYKALSSEVS